VVVTGMPQSGLYRGTVRFANGICKFPIRTAAKQTRGTVVPVWSRRSSAFAGVTVGYDVWARGIRRADGPLRAVAGRDIRHVRMTGTAMRKLRGRLALTQRELGAAVGVDVNTIARMERSEIGISKPVARLARIICGRTDPAIYLPARVVEKRARRKPYTRKSTSAGGDS
jgi:DNA-binding XRE family transcriptional regulator